MTTSTIAPPSLAPPDLPTVGVPPAPSDAPVGGWGLAPVPVVTGSALPSTLSFDDLSRRFVVDLVSSRAAVQRELDLGEATLLVLERAALAACALLAPYAQDGVFVLTDAGHAGVRLGDDAVPDAAWFGTLVLGDAEPRAVGAHVARLVVPAAERAAEALGRGPADTAAAVADVLATEVARLCSECERRGPGSEDRCRTLGVVLLGALEVLGEVPRERDRRPRAS